MPKSSSVRRRPPASRPASVPKTPVRKPAQTKPGQLKSNKKTGAPLLAVLPRSGDYPAITSKPRKLPPKRLGELAELAFALKAASLGFAVSKPYGDSERYDFILDPRINDPRIYPPRIKPNLGHPQRSKPTSKASRLAQPKDPLFPAAGTGSNGSFLPERPTTVPTLLWRVQVKCTTHLIEGLYYLSAQRQLGSRVVPYHPSEIDFLAAYVLPEDTWYIIPITAFLGHTGFLFRRRDDPRPGHCDSYRDAWHLLRPAPNL